MHVLYLIYPDILSVRSFILQASSAFILSIHLPDTGSDPSLSLSLSALSCNAQAGVPTAQVEGSLPLSKHHGFPCLPCLRAPPVCVQRTGRHRQACQRHEVENTKSKRTISIESPPCRPGAKDEATSCRKIFRQPIGNGSIAIPIAIPIARRRKHGASNPLLPRHRWGNIAAIMLPHIVISIVPPSDGKAQGRWQVVRGVPTRN